MAATIRMLHSWRLSYADAVSVQEELRERVEIAPLRRREIHRVAGSDVAVSKPLGRLVAAIVVMSFPDLDVLETRVATSKLDFPYIPGLLSFREIPALVACARRVRTPFDVMLCDGQGIAHPRRVGLASHFGLFIDTPTVGCAKSRLIGEHDEPAPTRGSFTKLRHDGQVIGSVLRTRDGVKPMYVSPGHLVDHASSRWITLACCTKYRLPEPTRLAHIEAGERKRTLEAKRGATSTR